MYLSMLKLNPRSRQVQAELRDPYQMHRTICKAFGVDKEAWKEARVLFRVDESNEGRMLRALVQSAIKPDWSRITAPDDYLLTEIQCKDVAPVFKAGQRLAFRLRANPTVKREGKREGIYGEMERLEWLNRKGEANGFFVQQARVISDGKQKGLTTRGCETVFSAAVFEGVLVVTDPDAFRAAFESGIGSAKGFGFGLLSVALVK